MGYLKQAKTPDEIKKLTVARVKEAYNTLATDYNKILDGKMLYCHGCNEHISSSNFYTSNEFASGYFPLCKQCCLAIAEQRTKKNDKPNECKESVQRLLQMMNLPYIDELYESCCKDIANEVNEKNRKAPILQYLVIIKSLPQYRGKKWADSEFPVEVDETVKNKKVKQSTLKRFGNFGFSDSDLLFLQDEYEQWISRCECNTIAQETLFERIACKKLEIAKATKAGKDTKDLDKALQDLMNSANILPRQNSMDAVSEGQTLGTLIEKYENDRPIPEPDPEFKDVDGIGRYITTFFLGHMSKVLGIKNRFSKSYEDYMTQYTVKPPEYEEDEDSEDLFDKIFGSGKQ